MPSTAWKEVTASNEDDRFEEQARKLVEIQRRNKRNARPGRALHHKPTGAFRATFEVMPDIPDHAKVGMFSRARKYEAYVRFSNGSSAHQPDRTPDVRGIAIKVLGVEGPKLLEGMEDASTQDFLLIQSPVLGFKKSDEFVDLIWAFRSKALGLPRVLLRFGLGGTLRILSQFKERFATSTMPVDQQRYFSALPIKWGDYAVKLGLKTTTPDANMRQEPVDSLLDELAGKVRKGPVAFDFMVQFFENEERTPIEDASVKWDEEVAPFVTVARLTIPKQDTTSPDHGKLQETVENLSFDPWHATEDFRPVGEVQRARKVAYKFSAIERTAAMDPKLAPSAQAAQATHVDPA